MWHALLLPLAGASPVEDLGAVLATDEGQHYRAAAVCTPLGPVLAPMGGLLLLLGAPSEHHERPDFLALGRLLDPGLAGAAGVALDGTLLFGADTDGGPGMAAVPFRGTLQEAESLLGTPSPPVRADPAGGWVLTPDGGQALHVQQVADHLVFRRDAPTSAEPPTPAPWLLRGLPQDAGCALYINAPEGLLDGLPPTTAAAVLPVAPGHDARIRISALDRLPTSLGRTPPPAGDFGSSTPTPAAVLRVNVPGLDLLQVPAVSANLGLGPQDHAALASLLTIAPGLTVAGFGSQDAPQVAATMGVLKPSGQPFSAAGLNRRIVRLLRGLDVPSQKLGRKAFVIAVGDVLLYGAADTGRLSVGTDPVVVAESLVGYGAPWVDADFAAFSDGRPVGLSVHPELVPGGLQAGLEGTDRTWDLTVRTGGASVAVLDTVVALMSPAYVGLRAHALAVAQDGE